MQLIISQIVYVHDHRFGIQCCLSADVLSAIDCPPLRGSCSAQSCQAALRAATFDLHFLAWCCSWRAWANVCPGQHCSCVSSGRELTLSHSRRSEHLLGHGSKIPACATQELGDCFSFIFLLFLLLFFPFILAAICCAQLLWLGEMRLLIPKVARREESQQLCPLPACRGGGAGRVAGQVGAGGTWCLLALYTTGRKSAQHSALLILMGCERPNDRGNKWEFWYLGKVLCNLPNMPSLHTQSQRGHQPALLLSLVASGSTARQTLGLFPQHE